MTNKIIEVTIISKDEAVEYPELVATIKAMLPQLNEEEILKVLSLIINTCPDCHAASADCRCWNDD